MTLTASIPTVRVKRLKPAYERMVRGPVRRPAAIAEIEKVASLTRIRDLSNLDTAIKAERRKM